MDGIATIYLIYTSGTEGKNLVQSASFILAKPPSSHSTRGFLHTSLKDRKCSHPRTQHNLRSQQPYRDARPPGQHDLLLFIERLALQFFRDADFVLAGDLGKDADTLRKSKTLPDATAWSA